MKPMLARDSGAHEIIDGDWAGYFLEPKHDGMRAIIKRTADGVEILSRTGKSQAGKLPSLEKAAMDLPIGTILDGELAVIDSILVLRGMKVPVVNFNKTMRVMGSGADKAVSKQDDIQIVFIAFDIPSVEQPQYARRLALVDLSKKHPSVFFLNPVFHKDLSEVNAELMAAGIEGSILKHPDSMYVEGGRPRNAWYKFKKVSTYDVVVSGVYEGEGKHAGRLGGFTYGVHTLDGFLEVGRVGGGLSDEQREAFWANPPIGEVIEIKANDVVGSGRIRTPRHPQFVTIRIDKAPGECTDGQFVA